jgi:phosphoribosyl-ATP pyrophosphohydrolase/phosphoribosyl-AMP cyclohydrolase
MIDPKKLDWDKTDGLIPAVIQDERTRQVLMLGYMNEEALGQTLQSNIVHFYSRSRRCLWMKGETSGNTFALTAISADCDNDTLLVEVRPAGPACHTNTVSCFGNDPAPGLGFLAHLEAVIQTRAGQAPEDSYVSRLLTKAPKLPAQKVGEEAVEVAIAAVSESREALIGESADLIFHLMVLLESRNVSLSDIVDELRTRNAKANASGA